MSLVKNLRKEGFSMQRWNIEYLKQLHTKYQRLAAITEDPTLSLEYENTANKKGYEPYKITTDTPYLYTIREVGGIATNAYVDGRNKDYSKNEYYRTNQGIECYQIELGYINLYISGYKSLYSSASVII